MDAIARALQGGMIMREILFRGQIRKYGEKVRMDGTKLPSKWVYGGVLQGKGDFSIIYGMESEDSKFDKYPVYTDTLGQYTGLTDKNGKKIFEGDYWIDEEGDIIVVEFRNCQFCFVIYGYDDELFGFAEVGELDCVPLDYYYINKIEFAGNIHDNPELLKGEE